MADEKLSQQQKATSKVNGWFYMIKQVAGIWVDYQISAANLFSSVPQSQTPISVNLIAGDNQNDTGQTSEPFGIEVYETTGTDVRRLITNDVTIRIRKNTTWFIDIYTNDAISNVIIKYTI